MQSQSRVTLTMPVRHATYPAREWTVPRMCSAMFSRMLNDAVFQLNATASLRQFAMHSPQPTQVASLICAVPSGRVAITFSGHESRHAL